MKKSFLDQSKPMLTVMLQCETPEVAIGRIRNANCLGADAYGLQVETLKPEYQNPAVYKKIFSEGKGRPFYVTNYRGNNNSGKTDEDNLGFTYEMLDKYIREGVCEDPVKKALIDDKHKKNLFKLELMPCFEP